VTLAFGGHNPITGEQATDVSSALGGNQDAAGKKSGSSRRRGGHDARKDVS
jgi:hypothetical protein